jgi:hypothetical protein
MSDHFAAPAPLSKGHQASCAGGSTSGDVFIFHGLGKEGLPWRRISKRPEHAGFRVIFLDQAKHVAGDHFRWTTLPICEEPQDLDDWSPWRAEVRMAQCDLALAIIADLDSVAAPELAAPAKRAILAGAAGPTFSRRCALASAHAPRNSAQTRKT